MDNTHWRKQTIDKPLFPDLIWSRPENKQLAGKLLIIGGNVHGFSAPAEAYQASIKAGIGTTRALVPDSLQKTMGRAFEAGIFAPSTPSGSFSQKALAVALDEAAWADGVLIAGDLGRNSETAILLEQLAVKYPGQLTITKDAADYFVSTPKALLGRDSTLLVVSFAQLQKLAVAMRFTMAFTFSMDFLQLTEALHQFTQQYHIHVIVKHLQNIFVATDGEVSATTLKNDEETWRVKTAAYASVWWLQNPSKTFEALSTSVATSIT